ncbi:MAG: hypothetical protein KDA87_09530 [Planctomycetales bacterium]|nr:hypothetical protein [Planctomycetales bacterium]
MSSADSSFLSRHEFLIRRLHSLSGLIPVGAYMCVHLITNASIMDSAAAFQKNVYTIHSLGAILPVVEWGFIFLPILFHAIVGVVIIQGGLTNNSAYPYARNARYTAQRVTGMIAFLFIVWHVFHLHGWFHFDSWLAMAENVNGANFRPYNAASSLAYAMQGFVVPVMYVIGVGSCIFHLANGIWTMGITWGVWTSPQAQTRAAWVALAFGIGLSIVSITAMVGVKRIDIEKAIAVEEAALEAKIESGEISEEQAEHKAASEEDKAKFLGAEEAHDEADSEEEVALAQ